MLLNEPRIGLKTSRLQQKVITRLLKSLLLYLLSASLAGCFRPSLSLPQTSSPLTITAQPLRTLTPTSILTTPTDAVAATQSAYPVSGSVVWEGGRCCAGGTAGETIQIRADYSASSPFGEISELRVRPGGRCYSEQDMHEVEWERFSPSQSFPFTLAINWVGFYISIQYRDSLGNLSPVYCDDISLEGMPPGAP